MKTLHGSCLNHMDFEPKRIIVEENDDRRGQRFVCDDEYPFLYNAPQGRGIFGERREPWIPRRIRYVQSYICNISFPTSLDELDLYAERFNLEDILKSDYEKWTVPKWAKPNDIVFFMHSKTAFQKISALRTALKQSSERYTEYELERLLNALERASLLYKEYGGRIFACGRIATIPVCDTNDNEVFHWRGVWYADIDNITVFNHPLDISDFREFITISRTGAITPVFDTEYSRLRALLSKENKLPEFVMRSEADPLSYGKINAENWLLECNKYRRHFMWEQQYRIYYVDYLLKTLCKTRKIYRECRCKKAGIPDSFVDNVIFFNGKYLPVEVKLLVGQWPIKDQVIKYCYDDEIVLDGKDKLATPSRTWRNNVLVIDTENVYMYYSDTDTITSFFELDNLEMSKITLLGEKIGSMLTY